MAEPARQQPANQPANPANSPTGWVVPSAGYQQPDAYLPADVGIARGGYTGRPAPSADQPRGFDAFVRSAGMRSDPSVAYQPADVSMPESYGIAKSGYSGRASEPPPRRSPNEGAKEGFYSGRPNDSARRPRSPHTLTSQPYGAQEGLGRPAERLRAAPAVPAHAHIATLWSPGGA